MALSRTVLHSYNRRLCTHNKSFNVRKEKCFFLLVFNIEIVPLADINLYYFRTICHIVPKTNECKTNKAI